MYSGMDRPLYDRYHVRYRLRCIGRQQLDSISNADSCTRLRSRHSFDAILHHAACIWTWSGCIKNAESYAGETSQLDESCCIWRGSLPFCIVGSLVAIGVCLSRRIGILKLDVKMEMSSPPWNRITSDGIARNIIQAR